MKPRPRLRIALLRIVFTAAALATWVAIGRACKDLMQ